MTIAPRHRLHPTPDERLRSGAIALALVMLAGVGLWRGLSVGFGSERERQADLIAFDVKPPPAIDPPVPPDPEPEPDPRPEGAASPPNLHSTPTEITAPDPAIALPALAPVIVARQPGEGSDRSQGAVPLLGPGTGSGGTSNGTGSGTGGNGRGRGGGTAPRHIAGRLSIADLPRAAMIGGRGGHVSVSYVVEPDGRATDCRIERTSGNVALDITTCELIEQRFRFDPARDADGTARRAIIEENHDWEIDILPPDRRHR